MILGKEMKTILLTDKEREVTAYHEAGHTLVNLLLPAETDPFIRLL